MATYYNQVTGSRILNSSRTDQSGSDDNAVTGWTIGDDFILAVHMDDASKDTEAGTYKLQWKKGSGGTFGDLADTGELNYTVGGATALSNGTACSETAGDWRCSYPTQGTYIDGTEREDSNDTVAFDGSDGDETEHQWAIACDSATAGQDYYFQLVDTANGDRVDAVGVSITMAAVGDLEVSVTDTIAMSDLFGPGPIQLPAEASDAVNFAELIASVMSDLEISGSDSISVSDVIQAVVSLKPNLSDTMSLSDAVSLVVGIIANCSDSFNFTETLSAIFSDLAISTSDAFGLNDVANAAVESLGGDPEVSVSDVLGFLENLQVRMVLGGVSVTDAFSFAESIATRISVSPTLYDQFGLTDALSISPIVLPPSVSDSFGLNESVLSNIALPTTVSDTVGFSELVSLFMVLGGAELTDSFSFTELISGKMSIPGISLSDSFGISESITVSIATPIDIEVLVGLHDGELYLKIGSAILKL